MSARSDKSNKIPPDLITAIRQGSPFDLVQKSERGSQIEVISARINAAALNVRTLADELGLYLDGLLGVSEGTQHPELSDPSVIGQIKFLEDSIGILSHYLSRLRA